MVFIGAYKYGRTCDKSGLATDPSLAFRSSLAVYTHDPWGPHDPVFPVGVAKTAASSAQAATASALPKLILPHLIVDAWPL